MGFLYLFFSILAESVGKTFDKFNFRRNHINVRQNLLLVFFVMAVAIVAFSLLTRQPWGHISLITIALLAGIVAFSFGGNIFDEMSLQKNDLSLREPLVDFEPILTGFIAYALFPGQRRPAYLVAFIMGTLIVYWGIHRRRLRAFQIKGMFYLWIAVILYAIVPIFYQEALHHLSPTNIALVRVVSILILLRLFFPPKKRHKFTGKMIVLSIGAGLAYGGGAIVSLYAIQKLGLVLTMLFTMLGPALRYLSGKFLLREKVRRGEVVASVLLALAVTVAAVFK